MTYSLATVAAPEGFVVLPMHVIGYSACVNCGEQYSTETYEEYVARWYATEYEGRVVESDGYQWEPTPSTREVWEYLKNSCLG